MKFGIIQFIILYSTDYCLEIRLVFHIAITYFGVKKNVPLPLIQTSFQSIGVLRVFKIKTYLIK